MNIPQKFSNIIPSLYGFLPRTYSKEESSKVAMESLKRTGLVGDEDPIDICILTDRHILHGDISRARYIKVDIESQKHNPAWHAAPGAACWLFIDEIVAE